MIIRQLFEPISSTYTYILAGGVGGEAFIIDPVKERLEQYAQVIQQLELKLVFALDTHIHADHVTALGDLRELTGCVTVMGHRTRAECVSRHVHDGETLWAGGLGLRAIYTPGHTDESFSFLLEHEHQRAVFTGDVLLIRGTGRTDFQGGDPHRSWESIVHHLFALPDDTVVYPAHDYRGWTASSIREERLFNPRIANRCEGGYVEIMNGLKLADPKLMDVAVRANLACGQGVGL